MFLISQSTLDLLCVVMLIATAWDIVYGLGGGHFGIKGKNHGYVLKLSAKYFTHFENKKLMRNYKSSEIDL